MGCATNGAGRVIHMDKNDIEFLYQTTGKNQFQVKKGKPIRLVGDNINNLFAILG